MPGPNVQYIHSLKLSGTDRVPILRLIYALRKPIKHSRLSFFGRSKRPFSKGYFTSFPLYSIFVFLRLRQILSPSAFFMNSRAQVSLEKIMWEPPGSKVYPFSRTDLHNPPHSFSFSNITTPFEFKRSAKVKPVSPPPSIAIVSLSSENSIFQNRFEYLQTACNRVKFGLADSLLI